MLIWFVVVYLLISLAIGLIAATRVHNAKDFAVAGRNLPLPIVMATVFATWFGAETVLGISATFVKDGLRGVVADPFGSSLCLILAGLFFAGKLYRLNLLTIGDYYRLRYNRTVEVLCTLAIVASYLGWVAAQIKALGLVFFVVTGGAISQPAGMVILCAYTFNNVHLMLLSQIGKPYDPVNQTGVIGKNYCYQTAAGATLSGLVTADMIDERIASLLRLAATAGLSTAVVGPRKSGKTSVEAVLQATITRSGCAALTRCRMTVRMRSISAKISATEPGQAEIACTMFFSAFSIFLAMMISSSRVSRSTCPISRIYMRTGSVVRPNSLSALESAASASATAWRRLTTAALRPACASKPMTVLMN